MPEQLTAAEFPRDANGNPSHHRCYDCGYVWQHGQHGGHDCKEFLKTQLANARAEIAGAQRWIDKACELHLKDMGEGRRCDTAGLGPSSEIQVKACFALACYRERLTTIAAEADAEIERLRGLLKAIRPLLGTQATIEAVPDWATPLCQQIDDYFAEATQQKASGQ